MSAYCFLNSFNLFLVSATAIHDEIQNQFSTTVTDSSAHHSMHHITDSENVNVDKNWPRAITPDNGPEGKEKRKKKVNLILYQLVLSGYSLK